MGQKTTQQPGLKSLKRLSTLKTSLWKQ